MMLLQRRVIPGLKENMGEMLKVRYNWVDEAESGEVDSVPNKKEEKT
jgi:hypothetical protein